MMVIVRVMDGIVRLWTQAGRVFAVPPLFRKHVNLGIVFRRNLRRQLAPQ